MQDYVAALVSAGLPEEDATGLAYLFDEVLDGRNARLESGVNDVLGRESRDFGTSPGTRSRSRRTMDDPLLTGGQALNGLLAGIYVAFVVAVMPALHGLPDDTFLRVMNRINDVIVNPAFLTLFLGAPVLAVILAAVRRDPLTIAAAVAALAALVITIAVHVPLNDALADGGTRDRYETPWVLWHYFRTGAAIVAFALLCIPTTN